MKFSFIGDICLARQINTKHKATNYDVVSNEVQNFFKERDCVIANLEAPICNEATTDGDHLSFKGSFQLLKQFGFVDYFSLSNNHINDCGSLGMDETIECLDKLSIGHNGIYKNNYEPIIINDKEQKIVIITCTDMINIPFSKENEYKILRIDDDYLDLIIEEYRKDGCFIILYAHVGILFSRFINPQIRNFIHKKIDKGVDLVVTAHSHCVGGHELYKGKNIFYSLGDFVMDGGSYRRRQSIVLNVDIEDSSVKSFDIKPIITNLDLETVFPNIKTQNKIINSWNFVSSMIVKNSSSYEKFFKFQYKKEMIFHSMSTLSFLYKTKGIRGLIKMIIKRYEEVLRMMMWLSKDRSKDRRDDEAIKKDRKKFSEDELFK